MIVRYATKKLIKLSTKIFLILSIIFSVLQVDLVQKYILNLISREYVNINFLTSTGIFPFNFSIKNLSVSNKDFDMKIDNVSINLSKKLSHIKNIKIDNLIFTPKNSTGISLSDFGQIIPIIGQKIAKDISIKKLIIGDQMIENCSFIFDKKTDLRSIRFLTKYGELYSSFKFDNTQIFANINFNDFRSHLIFGMSDNHLNIHASYKSNEMEFRGICAGDSINGIFNIPSIDMKLRCNVMLKNDVIESNIRSDLSNSSGRFRFNLSDNVLIADNIILYNGIIVKPFVMDKDLKIKNIDILLKKGKINIKNIDLSDGNFSPGDIEINNIEISQFCDFENPPQGILSGTGIYKNNSEIFNLKLKNFNYRNLKIPIIDIIGKYSKDRINIKLIYEILKKQNIIETEALANNWVISRDSKIKLKATGVFHLDDYKIPNNQVIGGNIKYNIIANGTLIDPIISGEFIIKNLIYLNPLSGTYIKTGEITALIKNNNISITKISATDDTKDKGTIKGSGKITIKKNEIESNISVEFNNFEIIEINNFDGNLFGKINIKGDIAKELKITGKLYTNNAKFNISNIIVDSARSVDLAAPKKKKPQENKKELPIKGTVNVVFSFNPDIKIVGYGIDSSWNGGAKIYGNISDIKYDAKLTLTKGNIKVSNKGFKLKDGEITSNSSKSGDYYVKLSAEKSLENIKVGARFIQNEKETDVQFYSKPSVPKRDILSYILFDKKSSEISAGEGFTLFSIMNKLSGGGGAFDITEKIQTVLGIDTIEIKKNTNDKIGDYSSVSIGKNLGKAKVSIDQGAGKDTTKVVLDAKVAKNTKVSVDLSGKDSIGAGISWNKRY